MLPSSVQMVPIHIGHLWVIQIHKLNNRIAVSLIFSPLGLIFSSMLTAREPCRKSCPQEATKKRNGMPTQAMLASRSKASASQPMHIYIPVLWYKAKVYSRSEKGRMEKSKNVNKIHRIWLVMAIYTIRPPLRLFGCSPPSPHARPIRQLHRAQQKIYRHVCPYIHTPRLKRAPHQHGLQSLLCRDRSRERGFLQHVEDDDSREVEVLLRDGCFAVG